MEIISQIVLYGFLQCNGPCRVIKRQQMSIKEQEMSLGLQTSGTMMTQQLCIEICGGRQRNRIRSHLTQVCCSLHLFPFLLFNVIISSNTSGCPATLLYFSSGSESRPEWGAALSALLNPISFLLSASVFKAFVHFSLSLLLISSVTENALVLGLISSLTDLFLHPACGRMRWFAGDCVLLVLLPFPLHWLPCMTEAELIWLQLEKMTNICSIINRFTEGGLEKVMN